MKNRKTRVALIAALVLLLVAAAVVGVTPHDRAEQAPAETAASHAAADPRQGDAAAVRRTGSGGARRDARGERRAGRDARAL